MCKAYLDTNILLDVASDLRPGHQAAVALFDDPNLSLAISAGSIKDFYYIAGSAKSGMGDEHGGMSDAIRREYIQLFLDAAEILADDRDVCLTALHSDEQDYEDDTKRAAAEAWGATWIVSRDTERHSCSRSPFPHCTAQELHQ